MSEDGEDGEDGSACRSRARAMLTCALSSPELAMKIESMIWNAVLMSCMACERYWSNALLRSKYVQKIMSIKFNVTNPANPTLRERVLDGSITPKKLATMTPYEMFPSKWQPLFEASAYRQMRRQLTTDIDTIPDGQIQCSKCRSRKTQFYEVQTRSADEPATIFVSCLKCGKRWKM